MFFPQGNEAISFFPEGNQKPSISPHFPKKIFDKEKRNLRRLLPTTKASSNKLDEVKKSEKVRRN